MRYVCPLRRGAKSCGLVARSDSKLITNHSCSLLQMPPLLDTPSVSFIHRPIQKEHFNMLARDITGKSLFSDKVSETTSSFVLSFFRMIGKCNISFTAATSYPFKNFLREFSLLFNPQATAEITTILSKLHLKALARMVVLINKQQKEKILNTIKNKSVSLMMDAAEIGGKSLLAITLLPHSVLSKPLFWKLIIGSSGAESYAKVSEHLINELSYNSTRVLFFCTDGLVAQRSGIESCTPKQVGDLIFFPYHIWCCSHLNNLVMQESIRSSDILSQTKNKLLVFGNEARKPANRTMLKARCPTFVETRWYALNDIVTFALNHRKESCKLGILDDETVVQFYHFKILLYPLIKLHLHFENNLCRLRHVFPAVIYSINLYFSLALKGIFRGSWLSAIKLITRFLYKRFLQDSTGNVHAAAYSLTQEGTISRQAGTFSRPLSFPTLNNPRLCEKISSNPCVPSVSSTVPTPLPLSTVYVDDAIHHILTVHFPPAILPSISALPRPDVQSDEYIKTLVDNNKELTELIELQELMQIDEQSGGIEDKSQHTGEEEEQSEGISFLELLDDQLVDSESDEEYIDSSYSTSSSSSSSSASSSSSTVTATAKETAETESQIAKSLRRNELIYDAQTQSVVSLRTLLKKKQTLQMTTSSSSSSAMLIDSPTSLVTWDEEGDEEVLELEPYLSPTDRELVKELSELYTLVHGHWYDRIIKGFQHYSQRVLRQAPPQFLSSLLEHFSAYLESYSDVAGQDLDALFCSRSVDTPYTAIYSYLAHGLVSASCSEASCERCFSLLRWIVGNRRYSLSLNSLACLLSLCMSE